MQKPSETHLAMRIVHWVSHSKLDIRPVFDRQCAPDVGKNFKSLYGRWDLFIG